MKRGARLSLTMLKVGFLVVAAIVAAQLVNLTLRSRWEPAPPTDFKAPPSAATALPTSPEQVVAQTRVLLGQATATPRAAPSAGASPGANPSAAAAPAGPDPLQGMTLNGTMVGSGRSMAFLSQAGKDVVLQDGDSMGPWKVAEITDISVVFAQGQDRRTLYLPSMQPTAAAAPPAPPAGAGLLPPPPAPVPAPASDGKVVLARNDVNSILSSPETYMKQMRVLPFQKDGRPYGAKVEFLSPGGLLSRLGLQREDILLSVNGQGVFTPEEGIMVYQMFKREDHLDLRIERAGKIIPIQVEIR